LEELAQDSGRADTGATEEQIVARLDAESRIREGADAEIWADARAIHVFDPQSGENLGLERKAQPA
jgi:multiple sugar transport system ATP-binding protein